MSYTDLIMNMFKQNKKNEVNSSTFVRYINFSLKSFMNLLKHAKEETKYFY